MNGLVGQRVVKDGGDYRFEGEIMARFAKKSGAVRVVVENEDGVLHIFSLTQLRVVACCPVCRGAKEVQYGDTSPYPCGNCRERGFILEPLC